MDRPNSCQRTGRAGPVQLSWVWGQPGERASHEVPADWHVQKNLSAAAYFKTLAPQLDIIMSHEPRLLLKPRPTCVQHIHVPDFDPRLKAAHRCKVAALHLHDGSGSTQGKHISFHSLVNSLFQRPMETAACCKVATLHLPGQQRQMRGPAQRPAEEPAWGQCRVRPDPLHAAWGVIGTCSLGVCGWWVARGRTFRGRIGQRMHGAN